MVILLAIMFVSFIAAVWFGFLSIEQHVLEKHKWRTSLILAMVCMLIAIVSLCGVLLSDGNAVDGAEKVAEVYVSEAKDFLYYDDDEDEYFVVGVNLWNPLKPTCRRYIDAAIAEKYIEAYENLKSVDLYEKGKEKK